MTLAPAVAARIDAMARATPQWEPWLRRVEHALSSSGAPPSAGPFSKIRVVPPHRAPSAGAPLLDGCVLEVPPAVLAAAGVAHPQDLEEVLAQGRPDPDLAILPLLLACGLTLAPRIPPAWSKGHCPVCGAWPALAESRGLERARRLRCARCAADWAFPWMRCPFCDERAHERLAALVPEPDAGRRVDACRSCLGYVKTGSTLRALSIEDVLLEDLETVALDVVALERGFARPKAPGSAVRVRVEVRDA